ncbi:MAG TPA: hypothetical protein VN969_35485 [Streptosporangiaceae bacterium]|nr:hypothetical protein [Streptosporangiaceae bacterium]
MGRAASGDAAGGQAAGLTPGNRYALEGLSFDWGEAYDITVSDEYGWRARRKDGKGDRIEAPTPDDLRRLIVNDYTLMPVPRGLT